MEANPEWAAAAEAAPNRSRVSTPSSPLPIASSSSAAPRRFGFFRPSHQHSASSATVLLGGFALLSRLIGLIRDKYIAHTFGAGSGTDAYNVAFQLPDLINYLLIGGAASISFVTILSRYRESGEHEAGDRALSVILNTMLLVLGAAVLVAEFAVPLYTHRFFPAGSEQAALCTHMTRILLPGQIFFFAGGVLASVALVRKQFTYQGISPLVYTLGIILGGLLFARSIGIPSLAWGALAGSIAGPFLVNGYAARRAGVRYRPILDFADPGLRAWVRLSLPLMLGVTVVFMDNIILTWFAKHSVGDISRLMNAKRLFTAPMAIIGQAAGAASLPFFASLYSRNLFADYASAVNRSVSRILAVAVVLSAAMFGLARPLVDLVYGGGAYHQTDIAITAVYFAVFTVSLPLWASQAIYARAFYAAGETRLPMIWGTAITAASIPLYWGLHRWSLHHGSGVVGLAWASNLAILAQTLMLATLAHRRSLVPLTGLNFAELLRSAAAAALSYAAVYYVVRLLPAPPGHLGSVLLLIAGGAAWAVVILATLLVTGSDLLAQIRRRRA